MPKLSWINDDSLFKAVKSLLEIAKSAKEGATDNFGKNVIDPFSAIFEMAGFNMTYAEWVKSEEAPASAKDIAEFYWGVSPNNTRFVQRMDRHEQRQHN